MAYAIPKIAGRAKSYSDVRRLQKYMERGAARERPTPDPNERVRTAAPDADLGTRAAHRERDDLLGRADARGDGDTLTIVSSDTETRAPLEQRDVNDEPGQLAPPTQEPRRWIYLARDDYADYLQDRFDELGITPRQTRDPALGERYNSVHAHHLVFTASPEWLRQHPHLRDTYLDGQVGFIRHYVGEKNILGVVVHEDQASMHMHVAFTPINAEGKLTQTGFLRDRFDEERLHTANSRYLQNVVGLPLERGHNVRLDAVQAKADPQARDMAQHMDEIPLDEVLTRLEGDRDPLDPRRWYIGDRIVQVHADNHMFTEVLRHGSIDGHGAIDLVARTRQEGTTPAEEYGLAVGYLAQTHPEHLPGRQVPPLFEPAPPERDTQPRTRASWAFGRPDEWTTPEFVITDTATGAAMIQDAAERPDGRGHGRVAVADHPDDLPLDEIDEAVAQGWTIRALSDNPALQEAMAERYPELLEEQGQQLFQGSAPSGKRRHPILEENAEVEKDGPDKNMDGDMPPPMDM